MSVPGHNSSNSASVTSSSDHAKVSGIELNHVLDLAGCDVQLDGVVNPDDGVGIPDGTSVTGVQEWNSLRPGLNLENKNVK